MSYYIGIDLGTSAVKVLLLSENGIEKTVSREYPLFFPKDGWSEQNPEDWYKQTMGALKELLIGVDTSQVKSVSFSGQMHGLVILDENDNVIRPAILWNDGRTGKETDYLNEVIGKEKLLNNTGNIAFAGFTAPKVLWVKENEPENFKKICKIMLPKDYIAYMLTGNPCTDVSDASGTLYFDVEHRRWSEEMLNIIGIREDMLPKVLESYDCAGTIKKAVADELEIPEDVKVMIGAGDNAAAAVGTGTIKDGDCNISLGTSGTIFVVSDTYSCDRINAIHSFCSASGNYHYMACMLSAASCSNWWIEKILGTKDYRSVEKLSHKLGENEVYWLPYLMGERSPLNDPYARAAFIGMNLSTTKDEMSLAILEGVAFALRQNLDIIRSLGVDVTESRVCGGGSKDALWLRIIASVLNIKLTVPVLQEGAALGAALLAAKGVMNSDDYEILAQKMTQEEKTVLPEPDLIERYNKKYETFLKIYPALKEIGR